jgi:hypothetical protein
MVYTLLASVGAFQNQLHPIYATITIKYLKLTKEPAEALSIICGRACVDYTTV